VDYAILSRTTDPLRYPLRAGKIYVQLHDVKLLSDQNQLFLDKITKFCCLSEWHKDFAADFHKIPKDKIVITANGIEPDLFDRIKVEKNPYRLHWSSSWDRGLDNVLYLWPFIKEQIPEAELHCYYGVFNWKSSCLSRNDQEGLKKIEELEKAVLQPGVFTYGRVNQNTLREAELKSSLLLYHSWFSETFFITGIECQYSRTPVICNRYAGVRTTFNHPELGDTAIMLGNGDPWWPYSREGREAFLNETVSILRDQEKWQYWSNLGRKNAERFSWINTARLWERLFLS
jgi:glycosyltransferase involved in cell wall biosynthesis